MRAVVVGAALACSGCALSLPEPAPYPFAPSAADPAPGMSVCSRTATAAHSLAGAQTSGAWALGAIGVSSATAGGFLMVASNQEARRIAGAGLTVGGVALGIAAYTLFLRATASSRLAEAANRALVDPGDRRAFDTCVRARASWEASPTSADAISHELVLERERENQRLREEIERLEKRPPEPPGPPLPTAPPPEPSPLGPRH